MVAPHLTSPWPASWTSPVRHRQWIRKYIGGGLQSWGTTEALREKKNLCLYGAAVDGGVTIKVLRASIEVRVLQNRRGARKFRRGGYQFYSCALMTISDEELTGGGGSAFSRPTLSRPLEHTLAGTHVPE